MTLTILFKLLKAAWPILAVVISLILFKQNMNLRELNEQLKDTANVLRHDNETYKNELGQNVTVVNEYVAQISDLEHSMDSLEQEVFKAVHSSKLKPKEIKEVIVIKTETVNIGRLDTFYIDSIPTLIFDDGYLHAEITKDSFRYQYTESITILRAARKVPRTFFLWKWLGFKKKIDRDLIEIVTANSHTKVKSKFVKLDD
jgi:predicted nuclease with TOPRIM domain